MPKARSKKASMQQRGLWERLTGKQSPAPVTRSQARQVSLSALPGPDVPLRLQGAEERWSFHSVMECGAEFTYLRLVKFEQRSDPKANQAVAPLQWVVYAE